MNRHSSFRKGAAAVATTALLLLGAGQASVAQDAVDAAPQAAEMAPKAVSAQMNDVALAGGSLVAVGDRGVILTSADGKSWKQSASPVDILLNAVYFADAKNGWAVGHDASIIHTQDGGTTWSVQNYAAADNRPFMDVLFLDGQKGFAIGAYGLFKTTQDGGSTWTDFSDPAFSERNPHLNGLTRLGDGSLLLVGEAGLVATSANGQAWTLHPTGYEGSLFAAIPRGARGVMVVGMRGTALETADSLCPEWRKVETGTDKSLFGLTDLGAGRVAIGGNGGSLSLLAPGKPPQVLTPPPEAGLSLSTAYGGLAYWNNTLLALTDRGVKVVYTQP